MNLPILKIPMINGKVYALCVGKKRGVAKRHVRGGFIKTGYGLEGDAHAMGDKRQISLLAIERITAVNAQKNVKALPGDFAENITTSGIDWSGVAVGSLISIGTAKLRVMERGKPEHGVNDYSFQGIALLAKEGIFAEVIESGYIFEGDKIRVCLSY